MEIAVFWSVSLVASESLFSMWQIHIVYTCDVSGETGRALTGSGICSLEPGENKWLIVYFHHNLAEMCDGGNVGTIFMTSMS